MNRKQTNLLATGAAIGTAILLLLIFVLFINRGGQPPDIILPPDMSGHDAPQVDDLPPGGEGSWHGSDALEITRENVKDIVADLARPDSYKAVCSLTYFTGGGQYVKTRRVTVLNRYQKTEHIDADGSRSMTEIMGPETTFIWDDTPGSLKSLPTGGFLPDASSLTPTYEDILSIDAPDIIGAEYRIERGRPCVWIHAVTPGELGEGGTTVYDTEYVVDMQIGLLIRATFSQSGNTVMAFEMTGLETDTVSPGEFVLPDGNGLTAMEAG